MGKSKGSLIVCILLIIVSLLCIFIGPIFNIIIVAAGLIILSIGIYGLMKWSTVNFILICEECGKKFEVKLKENIFGQNTGVNEKEVECPNCRKKTLYKSNLK